MNLAFHAANCKDLGLTKVELQSEIRRRAYELYQRRGKTSGHAMDDWLRAEAEVLRIRCANTVPLRGSSQVVYRTTPKALSDLPVKMVNPH